MNAMLLVFCLLMTWVAPALAVTLPTAPAATVDVTMPTVNGTTYNATCANLQSQLDAAAAANVNLTHEIILATGTTCTGPYVLPSHTGGTGWILIKGTNYASLPAAGTRVTLTDIALFPVIQYYENNSTGHMGAFSAATGANRYRIIGIKGVQNDTCSGCNLAGTNYVGFVTTGYGGANSTNTGYIIIDRSAYIDSSSTHSTHQGVMLQADNGNTAVIDSYIDGVKANARDADTQCILSTANAGPILIRNNFLRCAGENVMFGGGGTPSAALVPRDATITLNTFTKDLAWAPGGNELIKTELELKCGVRVLIEGNQFFNMPWDDGGYVFRLEARGQGGFQAPAEPWCEVSDVAIRSNLGSNVTNWIVSFGSDDFYGTKHSKRWAITNNLIYGLSYPTQPSSCATNNGVCGAFYTIQNGAINSTACTDPTPTCQMENLTIAHNTVNGVGSWILSDIPTTQDQIGLDFSNNLIGGCTNCSGMFRITPTQLYGSAMLAANWPGGYTMVNNLMQCCPSPGLDSTNYPQGTNVYTGNTTGWWTNVAANDYTVPVTSPGYHTASDGTDKGVNFTTYNAAMAGISSGATSVGGTSGTIRFSGSVRIQ